MFSRAGRVLVGVGITVLLSAAFAGPAGSVPFRSAGDFDGDGFRDLAIGAPGAIVVEEDSEGAAGIVYGVRGGPTVARLQHFDRSAAWVPGDPRGGEEFADQVAEGDFNADSYADLALTTAGGQRLVLLFGSTSGLARGVEVTTPGLSKALAAADFNADGATDLALAAPLYSDEPPWVLYGRRGLTADNVRYVQLRGDMGGWGPVAAGNLNGDAYPDLAVRTFVWDEYHALPSLVTHLGGPRGLSPQAAQVERGVDYYWETEGPVAVADLTGDGYGEVVIGNPHGYGQVTVLYGSSEGLLCVSRVDQNSPGIPGSGEDGDDFGMAIAAGDVDGDGIPDLVIGSPGEDVGRLVDAGMVAVVQGGIGMFDPAQAVGFTQNTEGVPATGEAGDRFGSTITIADLNRDSRAEVAIASVGENAGEGLVHVLKGSSGGVTAAGAIAFGPRTLRIAPRAARLGASLG